MEDNGNRYTTLSHSLKILKGTTFVNQTEMENFFKITEEPTNFAESQFKVKKFLQKHKGKKIALVTVRIFSCQFEKERAHLFLRWELREKLPERAHLFSKLENINYLYFVVVERRNDRSN